MHYISEFIRAATTEIYSGMVSLQVEAASVDDTVMPPVKPNGVTATIKFDSGFDAILHMSYSEDLAKAVTQTMMGAAPASCTAPEVGDVIGELANMIGGSFKAKMAGKGFAGNASAPSFTPNAAFTPQPIPGGIALYNLLKVPAAGGEMEVRVFAKI
jgi:CheY-specific phosphatase CheX